MQVRKLRDALSSKSDEVFSLENRAAQLEMSIEARKREIEAHRAVQRAQAKLAEEERHKLALDLADRQAKIALLKTKYETLCARLRGSDEAGGSAGGEQRSQAYFILKAAQKREELQREGDELDIAIRRAEREVKALAATLQHLNERNTEFRLAFHRVDASSDEASTVRALELQAKDTADMLFRRKRELASLASQADEASRQAAAMQDRMSALGAQLEQLEAMQGRADAERRAQLAAVEATRAKLAGARDRHRRRGRGGGGGSAEQPTADELAFLAQGLRESNSSVLFTLGQLAREFPQLKPTLTSLMAAHNMRMPARPPSRVPGAAVVAAPASALNASLMAGTAIPPSAPTPTGGFGASAQQDGRRTPGRAGAASSASATGAANLTASPIITGTNRPVSATSQGSAGAGVGAPKAGGMQGPRGGVISGRPAAGGAAGGGRPASRPLSGRSAGGAGASAAGPWAAGSKPPTPGGGIGSASVSRGGPAAVGALDLTLVGSGSGGNSGR